MKNGPVGRLIGIGPSACWDYWPCSAGRPGLRSDCSGLTIPGNSSGQSPGDFRLASAASLLWARKVRWHWAASGCICVYDPAFQLGYPKTPIFNGSRLAEVALFLGGDDYNPAAYKVGLLVFVSWCRSCSCWPVLGPAYPGPASLLATATGILFFWGTPGREAIEAGEFDFLIGLARHVGPCGDADSLSSRTRRGVLAMFMVHRRRGMVFATFVFPLALPLLLFYYLWVGAKHASLTWHGALLMAQVLAVAVNLPWLIDWVNYWWLRSSLPASASMLPHRTLQTLWEAPLWGGACRSRAGPGGAG